jgi:hypothetical protein
MQKRSSEQKGPVEIEKAMEGGGWLGLGPGSTAAPTLPALPSCSWNVACHDAPHGQLSGVGPTVVASATGPPGPSAFQPPTWDGHGPGRPHELAGAALNAGARPDPHDTRLPAPEESCSMGSSARPVDARELPWAGQSLPGNVSWSGEQSVGGCPSSLRTTPAPTLMAQELHALHLRTTLCVYVFLLSEW